MCERKTIRKWFWVWDFEKEELWLNQMAQDGWILDRVSLCMYTFVPCEPGEYTVRLICASPSKEYLEFMEETGAVYVGRMSQWLYFRKETAQGSFDLFSDLDSRIAHLRKIGAVLSAIGAANLVIGMANSLNPAIHFGWINLLCATLLMYALGRIHEKSEHLKRERMLRE